MQSSSQSFDCHNVPTGKTSPVNQLALNGLKDAFCSLKLKMNSRLNEIRKNLIKNVRELTYLV